MLKHSFRYVIDHRYQQKPHHIRVTDMLQGILRIGILIVQSTLFATPILVNTCGYPPVSNLKNVVWVLAALS